MMLLKPAMINNYSPKWRWIVVDIYRAAKRRGKYLPLFTDTKVNNCFRCFFFYVSIKGCPNSGKQFFIVKCFVSPSCRQMKLMEALVKLLPCHFLDGWVKFLLLLKPNRCQRERRVAVVVRKLHDRMELWFTYLVCKKKWVLRDAQDWYCRTKGQLAPAKHHRSPETWNYSVPCPFTNA